MGGAPSCGALYLRNPRQWTGSLPNLKSDAYRCPVPSRGPVEPVLPLPSFADPIRDRLDRIEESRHTRKCLCSIPTHVFALDLVSVGQPSVLKTKSSLRLIPRPKGDAPC